MASAHTEKLLATVEEAVSEAQAAEALYALLQATRAVPITFRQRTRAEALLQGQLLPRGLLGPEHPLVKLLVLRLSTHYLPGVSEFPLPPPPQRVPPPAHAAGKPSPAEVKEDHALPVAAAARIPHGGSGGSGLLSFLFRPLPRGVKAMCTVTRSCSSSTRLQPVVYRLHVETLLVAGGDGDDLRHALQAAGLDPQWVTGPPSTSSSSGREEADGGGDGNGQLLHGKGRCLLEARRLVNAAVSVAKTVQVAVYACSPSSEAPEGKGNGKGHRAAERTQIGRMQSPAPCVLTATATTTGDGSATASPFGSRLCVQVCERKRLLSLSVVLPVPAGRGNLTTQATETAMEVPLAHLQALCGTSGTSGTSAVFGARSRPPRWSALNKLYTLDFECGARRVREPSRKNVSLLDAAQLPAAPLHVEPRGGGGGLVGRGFSRGVAPGAVAQTAASAAAAEEAAGWAREKQPRPVLQLGKMRGDAFSLDFRAPFSPFQALAVAVAAFEA